MIPNPCVVRLDDMESNIARVIESSPSDAGQPSANPFGHLMIQHVDFDDLARRDRAHDLTERIFDRREPAGPGLSVMRPRKPGCAMGFPFGGPATPRILRTNARSRRRLRHQSKSDVESV